MNRLFDKLDATSASDEAGALAVLNRMRELVKDRTEDAAAWAELTRAVESSSRVSEREWRRVLATQNVATADQVRTIVASLTGAVLQYVPDPKTRQLIADRVNRLRVIEPIDTE